MNTVFIDGAWQTPHGTETLQLIDPATERIANTITLADEVDARAAIAAATRAYASWRHSTLAERAALLGRMGEAVAARFDDLVEVMHREYGAPRAFAAASTKRAVDSFAQARDTMLAFPFEQTIGNARVRLEPLGVVGIITPWNASNGFVCSKLGMAIAVGSSAVIKPSELSAAQTEVLVEALRAADVPPGLFDVVTGLGNVVGEEMVRNPDIAKITFTGSTAVGKAIARGAVETMKRVTLELGGKSPNILLPDADFATAIPTALAAAYMNSGQACIAGTRLLVPRARLAEAEALLAAAAPAWDVGPMVTAKQYERVQGYIRLGLEEGARLIAGGPGKDRAGYFVKPTVFTDVSNDMRIAREEIFGPVLCVIPYADEDDAVRIANDTPYGLQAYVTGGRAREVAAKLLAGRVQINGLHDEPLAPFGGFKQSGIGREFGRFGMDAYVEPKAYLG